jgi:hypothetical protein
MSDIYYTYASREELLAVGANPKHIYEDIVDNDRKLQQVTLTEEQCYALIPRGGYCYTTQDGQFKYCPFFDVIKTLPKQGNGFCHYLKSGDFTSPGTDLLWDSCKCCGVNDNDEDYE